MAIIHETEFDDFPTGNPGDSFVGTLNTVVWDNVDTMFIVLEENTTYTFNLDNPEMEMQLLTTSYGFVAKPPDGSNTLVFTTPDFFFGTTATYMIYVNEREFTDEVFNYTVSTSVGAGLSPDLTTEFSDISDTFWSTGETVEIDWKVANFGDGDAASSATTIYISTDKVIDATDKVLFTDAATGPMVSGTVVEDSRSFSFNPASLGLAPGTYWIGTVADSDGLIAESDEANNTSKPLRIEVVGPPTLGSIDDFADMMMDGYWEATGRVGHAFDQPGNVISVDITGLTAAGQQLARWAMDAWSAVANLSFQEVASGQTNITFDDEKNGAFTRAKFPGGVSQTADINISSKWLTKYGANADSYTLQTYIHELGHALGLGHTGLFNGKATYGVDNTFTNDSWQMSIMSYFNQRENTLIDATHGYVVGPMIADIVAIQEMYGELPVSAKTISLGDTIWGANSNLAGYQGTLWRAMFNDEISSITEGNRVVFTIYDVGGNDTMDFSTARAKDAQFIDMNAEGISDVGRWEGNVVIARGSVIENAIGGAGGDAIDGNDADNSIDGRGGDDLIYGNAGRDLLLGGKGDDELFGGAARDTLKGGKGNDDLNGDNGNDVLKGGADDDTLRGGAGNDRLEGEDGKDALRGETGDDELFGGAGRDKLFGGDGRDKLNGDAGNDRLEGGNDRDVLSGGNNADILLGGAGNDTLKGDAGTDQLFGATGRDALFGGFGADFLGGGVGHDVLNGQAGDDILNGGTGTNKLTGGSGADSFVFTGATDTVMDFDATEMDKIDLTSNAEITGYTDLMDNHISQVGADVVIDDLTGNTLVMKNVTLSALTSTDYLF